MKVIKRILLTVIVFFISSGLASAVSPDKKGCVDHPLFPTRMAEYSIENCDIKELDAINFETGQRNKNRVEGRVTRLAYRIDDRSKEASGLAVVRNYENAIKSSQGAILFIDNDRQRIVNGKMLKDGKEIWIQAQKGNGKIWLTILEKTEMARHVAVNEGALPKAIGTNPPAAVDDNKLKVTTQPVEKRMLADDKNKLPSIAPAPPGDSKDRIASLLAADAAKRKSLEAAIFEKARPGSEKYKARMSTLQANAKNRITVSKLGAGKIATPAKKPVPIKDPAILSISPDAVAAGDRLTINVVNVTASIENNEVYFSYAGGSSSTNTTGIKVKPVAAKLLEDGNTALEVIVPRPNVSWYVSEARLYISTNDHAPVWQTEPVAFTFTNDIIAKINLIEPVEAGQGDWQTITGSNLKPDTQVHYRLLEGGTGDAIATTQYISSTKMRAQVPPYTATQPFNGYVYVSTKTANNSIVNDSALLFILKPTIKQNIGSVFQMQGTPGDPVLITGTSFAQPVEVYFMMGPTGPELKADRLTGMTDTQIITYVPEFSGVVKPVDGFVYVKVGVVKSNLFPFRMVPTTEYKPISLSDYGNWCIWFDKRNEVDNYTIDSTVSSGGKVIGIIGGHHRAKLTEGFSGVDRYFSGVILKNGWVVDNVDSGVYWGITKPGKAGASISESHVGSSNALVAVAWWNTPVDHDIWYWLQVTIKGPKGVSHK